MEADKRIPLEVDADGYDASDRPFDFLEADAETALVCEADRALRDRLTGALRNLGYQTTEAESPRDALKRMRFHQFDMVVLDEGFGRSESGRNEVLAYLHTLNMSLRRQMFVALVSPGCRTMDNMAAFNKSVNLVINPKNADDAATILKGAVADNAAFYRVMTDSLKKLGRT